MQRQRAKDRWGHILLQDECWKYLTPLAAIALALVSVSLCYRCRRWRPKKGSVASREFCFLSPNIPGLFFLLLQGVFGAMAHNDTQWHTTAQNGTPMAHIRRTTGGDGAHTAHNGTWRHTMARKRHTMAQIRHTMGRNGAQVAHDGTRTIILQARDCLQLAAGNSWRGLDLLERRLDARANFDLVENSRAVWEDTPAGLQTEWGISGRGGEV